MSFIIFLVGFLILFALFYLKSQKEPFNIQPYLETDTNVSQPFETNSIKYPDNNISSNIDCDKVECMNNPRGYICPGGFDKC